MSKKAELDQLQEAVKQQPGSRTYAILAQRYLEEGALEEALRICRAGYEANPDFEDGAVTYLRGLRRAKDLETAEMVYRSSLTRHPGSASLRVAWAAILLDARREPEARRLAREAVDLDPENDEAGALLASLGEARPGPAERKALVRPWVRPVGQRTSATSLFDLSTPEPTAQKEITDERYAFDATPMPMNPIPRPDAASSPLIGGPDDAPATASAVAEADEDGSDDAPLPPEHDHADTEVDPFSAGAPPPSAERDLFPDVDDPTASDPMRSAPGRSAPMRGAPGREMPAPPPWQPDRAPASAPPLDVAQEQGSAAVMLPKPEVPRRRWIWILALVPLLAGGIAIGYFYLRHHRQKELRSRVAAILQATRTDRRSDYEQAKHDLAVLAADRGADPALDGAAGLVDAHLLVRFGVGARGQVARRLARAKSEPTARVGSALLETTPAAARRQLQGLAAPAGLWHLRFVRLRIAIAEGDKPSAERILAAEQKLAPPAVAVLVTGARLARLGGDLAAAGTLLASALEASPKHAGAQIESALLTIQRGGAPPPPGRLREVVGLAGEIPRLRAGLALLIGYAARQAGRNDKAVEVAQKASRLDPSNVEAAWLSAIWQLAPKGDAAAAFRSIAKVRPSIERHRRDAALWEVWALLQLGRPHQARRILDRLAPAQLAAGTMRSWRAALAVRCAAAMDARARVGELCRGGDLGPRARVACVEALLRYPDIATANKLIARFGKKTPVGRYLAGLRALARGDAASALEQLKRAHERIGIRVTDLLAAPFPDPAGPLFALAEAQTHHNRLGRAVDLLRRAVEVDARSAGARLRLARGLVAIGHDTEARTLVDETLAMKPDGPRLLAGIGRVLLDLGLPERARSLLELTPRGAPPTTAMSLLAGRVALADGKLGVAQRHFASALRHDPRSAEAMIALAQTLEAQRKSREARRLFARALRVRPHDPGLLLLLAQSYSRLGRYKDALRAGKKAIKHYVRSRQRGRANEAMVTLGRAFATSGDRWAVSRAEELLFEACKSKDTPAIAFYELGRVYRSQKDNRRAIWCLKRATTLDAKLAVAYRELGFVLRTKPKWRGRARAAFRAYLRLSPGAADATRIRALIRRR